MSVSAATVKTATIRPELLPGEFARPASRTLVVAIVTLLVLFGFGLRAYRLSAEGLSEDELNKVRAVADYRANGLTSANGEHPFLMKALLTASSVAADVWNASSLVKANEHFRLAPEAAVRIPGAILGALSAALLFLIASELFGVEIGLIAAALWAFDPSAIGFNRIAKEETFLLFFFLLANFFWLRGQSKAEGGAERPEIYYWATAAAFGAMMASKYVPHYISISAAYYYIFQGVKSTRWRMGKRKWLAFFLIMGAAFVMCNPTILLPGTWHEMRIFAGEKRIGHDSYEFMGELYRNQMTLWLKGSPWYFYYVFMGVKLPIVTVAAFLIGLPLIFTRRLGDGRFFVFFWLFFWFFPFTFLGGKFTRYFTFALPAVLVTAAIGLHYAARTLGRALATLNTGPSAQLYVRSAMVVAALVIPLFLAAGAAPHYRLYTNNFGGGMARAGEYFPHDEFYDSSTRDAVELIARNTGSGVKIASETPELITHYVQLFGRNDFISLSLSDRASLQSFEAGDVILVARGRRYFSNEAATRELARFESTYTVGLGTVESVSIYVLDAASARALRTAAEVARF